MAPTNDHTARRHGNSHSKAPDRRNRQNRHANTSAGIGRNRSTARQDSRRSRGSHYRPQARVPRPQAPANAPTGPRASLTSRITPGDVRSRRDSAHGHGGDERAMPQRRLQDRMTGGSQAAQHPQVNARARANIDNSIFTAPSFSEMAYFPQGAPQVGHQDSASGNRRNSHGPTHIGFHARTDTNANARIFTTSEMHDIIACPPNKTFAQASSLFISSQPTQPTNIPLPLSPVSPFPPRRIRTAHSSLPTRVLNQPLTDTRIPTQTSKRPINTYRGTDTIKKLAQNKKLQAVLAGKAMPKERKRAVEERVELRLGGNTVMK